MEDNGLGGILSTVGGTPLVRLERLLPGLRANVFAKLERFNPGGSVKDRTALSMLLHHIRAGTLDPAQSVVIESSSGNLAIGLAQVCRYFGLRFICVVDAKTTEQNIAVLKAYGAAVEVVEEPDPDTGEFLPVRLRRVDELVSSTPHAFWPDQYANPLNPKAHEETMREITEALDGQVDYLFCSVSTTGTLRGCVDYIRANRLGTTCVAVDAVGSVLFGPGTAARRLIPGHGASVRPALLDPDVPDVAVQVTDLDCIVGCRRLTSREAILAGGSSGATVAALDKLSGVIAEGSNCVLVFPDGGDRYLNTIYSDEWVTKHFGEVFHLWKDESVADAPC